MKSIKIENVKQNDKLFGQNNLTLEYVLSLEPYIFLLNSGGKDSVIASHKAVVELEKRGYPKDRVIMIYSETHLSLPKNAEYIKEFAKWLGVKLVITHPEPGYDLDDLPRLGLPAVNWRWCNREWKMKPAEKVHQKYPKPWVDVMGIRIHESDWRFYRYIRRKPLYYDSLLDRFIWLPIYNFTDYDRKRYIKEYGIPENPLWNVNGHSSTDCVICLIYAKEEDFRWLRKTYPAMYYRLLDLYKKLNANRKKKERIVFMSGVDLEELERRIQEEEKRSLAKYFK